MAQDSELIVSVSGIRGIVGAGLTPDAATAFAAALGTSTGGGRIVLSRDGRPSGAMLRHAVLAGLLATGCEVHDLGVAATPTVGLAVRRLEARGGIQITASHNPAPWNGLKLFGPDGAVLSANAGQQLKALFDSRSCRRVAWDAIGTVTDCQAAADWHRQRVLELVDVPAIRARQPATFLDANRGAGGPLGRYLLQSFWCRGIYHGCEADGRFAHEPEPIESNLRDVCPRVAAEGCDIGFVLDPDSDRLALIDETGRYIGEELTLALAVLQRLLSAPALERGPIVVNMSTSRVVEDIAARFGVPCYRSAVGEANVVARMRELGALIGGEGNGGVIEPRLGWVRDPFIGMGLVLNLMADNGKKLSELVAELPAYTIVKEKYAVDPQLLPGLFTALEQRWPETKINRLDGLRLDWPDRWVHVRSSNTEPIVRVIAEAPETAEAEGLCREVGTALSREATP
jgi:phosphomannomutase